MRKRGQRLLVARTSGTAQYDGTRSFYRRLGYMEHTRVPDYWTDGDDLAPRQGRRMEPLAGRLAGPIRRLSRHLLHHRRLQRCCKIAPRVMSVSSTVSGRRRGPLGRSGDREGTLAL